MAPPRLPCHVGILPARIHHTLSKDTVDLHLPLQMSRLVGGTNQCFAPRTVASAGDCLHAATKVTPRDCDPPVNFMRVLYAQPVG